MSSCQAGVNEYGGEEVSILAIELEQGRKWQVDEVSVIFSGQKDKDTYSHPYSFIGST